MTEEFNLSEKIIILNEGINTIKVKDYCPLIHTEDVKEFIRRLKEEVKDQNNRYFGDISMIDIFETMDKLAGEKLK
jgi:hypothetical protein